MTTTHARDEPNYPLATSSWDDQELAALQRVIESGRFTMGAEVAAFEEEFARLVDARYAVMVNSGSSANLLMVASMFYRDSNPLRPGDEVIVPAVSWPTTYYPLHQYGLKLVFVDVDSKTLNMDLNGLAAAISDRTRLVMAVNLLGNPNDFNAISALIGGKGIELVEDNCESLGAMFEGKQAGTFGTAGSFSSFFSHHISTMEGGVVVTNDEELYHILLCLRAHGWTRNLPPVNRVTGRKSDDAFEESFNFVLPGYNVRPLEMEAAVGRVQVRKAPQFVEQRRRNAAYFRTSMSDQGLFDLQAEVGQSSWFGFSLVLRQNTPLQRRDVVTALEREGIECRPVVAGNFAKNPVLRFMDHQIVGDLPNAHRIDTHGLFVGNQERDLRTQIDLLASVAQDLERV